MEARTCGSAAELAHACKLLAAACSDEKRALESIAVVFHQGKEGEPWNADAQRSARGGRQVVLNVKADADRLEDAKCAEDAPCEASGMQSELDKIGAKRSRVISKEHKYEQFLKQQRLVRYAALPSCRVSSCTLHALFREIARS